MANFSTKTRIRAEDMASPALRRIANQAKQTARSFRTLNATAGAMRSVGRLARPLERAVRLTGIAAFGAAAGAIALTDRYATARDEQAKFARQIGFSAESLDRLKFIAERQGASLDGLRSGLTAFTKRVGELRAGTGGLNSILKKTDPAFAQLLKNTSDNEEAFELFVAKVASLPDEQAKAALAAAGVSRGSMGDIIRLTDGGTAAYKMLRSEADKFRAPISPRDLRNAEAYKDAQTNLSFALGGVSDTISSRLVPVLTPFVERMADWVSANRAVIGTKFDAYAARIGRYLSSIDFDRLANDAASFARSAKNIAIQADSLIDRMGGIPGVIETVAKAWLILRGLSLASVVLTVGGQSFAIAKSIRSIALASRATAAAATADFARIEKNAMSSRKRMMAGGALGIATGIAAGINIPGQAAVDKRRAELESEGLKSADAFSKAMAEQQAANADAFDGFLARNLPSIFGGGQEPMASPAAMPRASTPARPIMVQQSTPQVEGKIVVEVEAAPGTGAVVKQNRTTIHSRPRGAPVGTTMNEGN